MSALWLRAPDIPVRHAARQPRTRRLRPGPGPKDDEVTVIVRRWVAGTSSGHRRFFTRAAAARWLFEAAVNDREFGWMVDRRKERTRRLKAMRGD